jgi:hypothetical protein
VPDLLSRAVARVGLSSVRPPGIASSRREGWLSIRSILVIGLGLPKSWMPTFVGMTRKAVSCATDRPRESHTSLRPKAGMGLAMTRFGGLRPPRGEAVAGTAISTCAGRR